MYNKVLDEEKNYRAEEWRVGRFLHSLRSVEMTKGRRVRNDKGKSSLEMTARGRRSRNDRGEARNDRRKRSVEMTGEGAWSNGQRAGVGR